MGVGFHFGDLQGEFPYNLRLVKGKCVSIVALVVVAAAVRIESI